METQAYHVVEAQGYPIPSMMYNMPPQSEPTLIPSWQGSGPSLLRIPAIPAPTPIRSVEKQEDVQQLRREVQKLARLLDDQKQAIAQEQDMYDGLIRKLYGIEASLDSTTCNQDVKVKLTDIVKSFGAPKNPEPIPKSSAFHELQSKSAQPIHEQLPREEKESITYAPIRNGSQFNGKNRDRYCKPCRLIHNVNKTPFRTVTVSVQKQFTLSKKETLGLSKDDREKLVTVPVRIMGSGEINNLYFVAKDVCLLIHTRKGNVAKSIGQFNENEKARMPVLCPRSNGTVSTHILTVLSIKGVKRLLTSSRSSRAPHVLKWIMGQVEHICGAGSTDNI